MSCRTYEISFMVSKSDQNCLKNYELILKEIMGVHYYEKSQFPMQIHTMVVLTQRWQIFFMSTLNCALMPLFFFYCLIKHCAFIISPSEFGIYVTRYRTGPAGFPVCRILRRDHMIRDIPTIGVVNQVLVLSSPGFTLDPPEMLVHVIIEIASIDRQEWI